ncbi:DUF4430 domain-containing protein [[Clostridium] polysaccharolyticum]|uniref:Transcobalamin-like C-terminal domain-containing protein n=1 Tax=[Clostridium] polysaccharolyticum TaxID=29364 RepID=A0A1I0A8U8_9FIRM|nr:DUF4430 domain-containing protein [[Clostridium] polysaccharolyticum]SES90623.1 protein of unknown function [[Clostridium] polysaccharolyticum]
MKRRIANLIMVLSILLIVLSGVMAVGNVKGWFQKADIKENCLVEEKTGEASITRSGIAYSLSKGTILREQDVLETMSGSGILLKMNGIAIGVDADTRFAITKCNENAFGVELHQGVLFLVNQSENFAITVKSAENSYTSKGKNTVFSADVQNGVQTISVLSGTVGGKLKESNLDIQEGQTSLAFNKEDGTLENDIQTLEPESLDSFILKQAITLAGDQELFVSIEKLNSVIQQREQEKAKANEELLVLSKKDRKKVVKKADVDKEKNQTKEPKEDKKSALKETESEKNQQLSSLSPDAQDSGVPRESQKPARKEKAHAKSGKKPEAGKKPSSSPSEKTENHNQKQEKNDTQASGKPEDKPQKIYECTISIHCTSILSHMEDLKESKTGYVPSDGCILTTTKVEFTDGETVYDVLKRTCDTLDIQMEAAYTPLYKTYYVEGIHNLYEFDCGRQSGWMYKVNGWYPNYGCSSYKLKDGDAITWNYTCEGLGKDVS